MKKFLLTLFILISCLFVCFDNKQTTNAISTSNEFTINTLYPENILYYQNLSNLNQVSANDNYVAYTLSNSINILNKTNKEITEISSFNNIYDILLTPSHQLIVIDYDSSTGGSISIITINETDTSTTILDNISLDNLIVADLYSTEDKIFIGLIKSHQTQDNFFELYEIEINGANISAPVKTETITNEKFNNAKHLAITDTSQIVIFEKIDDNNTSSRIFNRDYHSSDISPVSVLENIQLLDYYTDGTNEYLVAFTLENLSILSLEDFVNPVHDLTNLNIKDINIFNNIIYVSDSSNKSITTYSINTQESTTTISKEEVLVCSSNNTPGRFNSVTDIYLQGNTLYISDSNNDRIQIIDESLKPSEISGLEIDSNPHSVLLDKNQNIYFVKHLSTKTSAIVKYVYEDNSYSQEKSFSTYDSTDLGLVSDIAISNNNEIYIIDYTNNNLVILNNDTSLQSKLTFNISTNDKTKIEYLKELNLFVILNDNTLYLLDPNKIENDTNPIINSLGVSNATDITCDLDDIIILENNKISIVTISNNIMKYSNKTLQDPAFTNLSCITYDVVNQLIYGFNNSNQSIVYFDFDILEYSFNFSEISKTELLSKSNMPIAINIKNNAIIYDKPYNIGNKYEDISNCIGIETHGDYYRVLFEYNNNLKSGFIESKNCTIIEHNTTKKNRVLTTNIKVPVYRYPTILKYENNAIITTYIPINTYINISYYSFPITIDSKQFYLYEVGDTIGYIFNADVVLDDNKNIIMLQTDNASISAIGMNSINVYNEARDTIVAFLSPGDRIYVENFDKDSEYTLISFKTEDLNVIKGYVKTEYIELDELEDNKIILICIIAISVLILITILITYLVFKKKKSI